MGRRESIAMPSPHPRVVAPDVAREIASIRTEIRALLDESKSLLERSRSPGACPDTTTEQIARCGMLNRDATLCCVRATGCLRAACGG